MATYLTAYVPSVNGFRFGNRFPHQTIGPLSACGRSSGMSQVSLDYFYAGRPAPAIEVVDYGVRPVSGLGAASWAPDRVDLFVRRDGDRVAIKRLEGGRFGDWHDLTSSRSSLSPTAASWRPDRIDVLVRGTDMRLWHQWYDQGWVGANGVCQPVPGYAEDLGGLLDSSPAIAAPCHNHLDAFARGTDGELWFRHYDGTWHGWASLGRPHGISLTSDPSAAGQSGWTTVLVRGSDNAIWQKEWADNAWQPWRCIGGEATAAPAVTSPYPGRAEAYVRGLDMSMHLNICNKGHWEGWKSLGAPPAGLSAERPAAISHKGLMDVYALTKDQTVWHKRWSNGWQPWQSTEVIVSSSARALTDAIQCRLMDTTVDPLLKATRLSPLVPPIGTCGNFVRYLAYQNDALFRRASTEEMSKLADRMRSGLPTSVGMLGVDAFGHEVVVFGGEIDPFGASKLRVYDPNYPGCDQMTITLDSAAQSITSSSGEVWRSLWIRDDIKPETPPV